LSDFDEMVARINGGDSAGASALHESFSDRIYFIALRELRSPADAEDVRNETLLRVMESIRAGKLASSSALPAFVIGTARNVIREVMRKGKRAESMEERDFAAPAASEEVDPGVRRAIEAVLRRLKPRERDFVRLYYYEELPKQQISEQLGIHEDRVRLIKSRALKSFREMYERLNPK